MAVTVTNDCLLASYQGRINVLSDTFKVMLLTASYTPSRAHSRRSDVTAFEVSGTGYTAGGATVALTAAIDGTNNKLVLIRPVARWSGSTVTTAKHAAIYKARGGAASADELLWIETFETPATALRELAATTVKLFQNG